MVVKAASPRESIDKVFERVGVYGFGGGCSLKRRKYVIEYEEDECKTEMEQICSDRTKNVLILMSDTGGGHRASAEAIRAAFQLEFGDKYRVFVKDVWKEYTGWPLNDLEGQYKFMVNHGKIWNVTYHTTSPKWVHSVYLAALAVYYAKEVEAGLMEYKPDIIITVHPLMQRIPIKVLKWQNLDKKVLFVTVVTDLTTCHRTWFEPGVTRLYCPSTEVTKSALLDGLEESQLRLFGLPIRPSFVRSVQSKDDLRLELKMDPELPAALLMGLFGPVKKTAQILADALYDKKLEKPIGQLIIICGRNETLVTTLRSVTWKIPVMVRGFENEMQKWMGACDCIITKAGPGTIAEAFICGLPIILNDYIPGQEKGNVPYVVDNGAGIFTRDPHKIARNVAEWFTTKKDELKRMSENARKMAKPNAVFDIVNDIHKLYWQRNNAPYMLTSTLPNFIC